MEENQTNNQQTTTTTEEQNNQIEEAKAFLEMQEKLKKLEKENKDLLQAKKEFYDKQLQVEPPTEDENGEQNEEPDQIDLKKFSEDFFKDVDTHNNLDVAVNLLKINDERKRRGLPSGFLPVSSEEEPTFQETQLYDYDGKLEKVLRKCVEEANGDSHAFDVAATRYIKNFNKILQTK